MMQNFFKFVARRKITTGIIVVVLIGGGYFAYQKFTAGPVETRYVMSAVGRGTIVATVSSSGQVSVLNQVDIKPKVSGDLLSLNVVNGQKVNAGALLALINASDALKSVRDAEANLASAQLSLEKLQQPADQLTILQAENALLEANESKQNAMDDLQKVYDDGFNTVSSVFLDLPTIMAGLNEVLFGNTLNPNQQNIDFYANAVKLYDDKVSRYRSDAYDKYQVARAAYDKNFSDYKSIGRYAETDAIESLINESYDTTKSIAESVKSANNLIQFYEDKLTERNQQHNTIADTHLSALSGYTGKTNSQLVNLLSAKTKIQSDKDTIVSATRTIAEKTESLAKLKAGADLLDLQSQQLTIRQRQNALTDAREKLVDYTIRAPFTGIIAAVNVKKGDAVSGSTAIATLITERRIAEISLNEVDVAKIKLAQKATLTFDAVSNLSLTGEVAQIDTIGNITQGVVTYNVQIGFDAQDDRIKPGMSVSAAIITDIRSDVLLVPNAAVKTQGNQQYVQVFASPTAVGGQTPSTTSGSVTSATPPERQTVITGLSNDTQTEIVSGLEEGDQVVTQTVTGSSSQSQSQSSSSGLRILQGGGGPPVGGFGR